MSRPVLFLSIATAFSDEAECCSGISDGGNDLNTYPEPGSEQSPVQPSMDTRYMTKKGAISFKVYFLFHSFYIVGDKLKNGY